MLRLATVISLVLLSLSHSSAHAMWAHLPVAQAIQQTDLVVIATLEDIADRES